METSDLPKISRRRKSLASATLPVLAGAIAALVTLAITRAPGPGLAPDSASYLGAAESLVGGRGYRLPIAPWTSADSTAPLAHFPPGYSSAIALPMTLGLPPVQSARMINVLAAFLDVALLTALVTATVGVLPAAVLAVAIFVMPAFLEVHLDVLSEPLFLACLAGTLASMCAASAAPNERRRLLLSFVSGVAAAGAVIVRYAGVAACAAVVLWILLLPGSPRMRARRVSAAVGPSVVVLTLWLLRTRAATGVHGIRNWGIYGGTRETLRQGVATIVASLVPLSPDETLAGRRWIALVLCLALVFVIGRGAHAAIRLTKQATAATSSPVSWPPAPPSAMVIAATSLLAVCYLVVLVVSRLVADPAIPFDERILSPLFVLGLVVAAVSVPHWWRASRSLPRLLCAALVVGWLVTSFHVSSDEIESDLEDGHDLAETRWRASPLLAWARANASARPLYSNWAAAVVLHLHRPSYELPNDNTTLVLRRLGEIVRARHGVVLCFDTPNPGVIGAEALAGSADFRRVAMLGDGSVFAAGP